jgi:putative hydrolase of the HAD superfamily
VIEARAVIVDLDDTLYPQADWLRGAWRAVAAAAPDNVDGNAFERELLAVAAEGSDKGRIIDRAIALANIPPDAIDVAALVAVFRAHAPASLDCYDGALAALRSLRACVPVALLTDGVPETQRAKIRALGLREEFDAIVISDELGREFRKPHPAPFLEAAARLGVRPEHCAVVGDRVEKDVAGALAARLAGAVRVRTGEHAGTEPCGRELATVASFPDAVAWLAPSLRDRTGIRT